MTDPTQRSDPSEHALEHSDPSDNLMGTDGFLTTPSLAVAAGYPLEDFKRFLRTGVALGGRTLPTMTPVAKSRFVHFTDSEIEALHVYFGEFAEILADRP